MDAIVIGDQNAGHVHLILATAQAQSGNDDRPAGRARRADDRCSAGTGRTARERTPSLLCLRASVPNSRGRVRRVQGAIQRRRALRVPYGYVGGVQCDPIEKKPFFHAYPGALAFSFGHAGLRPALQLLSELGHVTGTTRSGCRFSSARCQPRRARRGRRRTRRTGRRLDLQRATDHR